jgi:arsenite/tail-anchored protein-transporting ATPase
MKLLFFMGKGGVGKSTLASLCALAFAQNNKQVILASLDPAHNLSDIFEKKFSDKPNQVSNKLKVIEVNEGKWVKKYLKNTEQQFSKSYTYLTSFSLDKHFSVICNAPGIEEYGLLMAFQNIIQKSTADIFIFDMPPTGLALKFFSMPQVSLLWLGQLNKLRQEILNKQKIVTKLSFGNKMYERDRAMQNIDEQSKFWRQLQNAFSDINSTRFVLIQNQDSLSKAESERIQIKINDLNLAPTISFLNKAYDTSAKEGFDYFFDNFETNVLGEKKLQHVLQDMDIGKLLSLFEF